MQTMLVALAIFPLNQMQLCYHVECLNSTHSRSLPDMCLNLLQVVEHESGQREKVKQVNNVNSNGRANGSNRFPRLHRPGNHIPSTPGPLEETAHIKRKESAEKSTQLSGLTKHHGKEQKSATSKSLTNLPCEGLQDIVI
jgi:hypothetical protein